MKLWGLFFRKAPFGNLHSSRYEIFWHSVRDTLNPKGYQAIGYSKMTSVSENHGSNLGFEGMEVKQ